MRSAWLAAVAIVVLGGCDAALVSRKPLFDQGRNVLKPGLWAVLPEGCSTPADARVFDWDQCAKPARVSDGELTIFSSMGPVKLGLVASDGMPVILQASADKQRIDAGASDLYGSGQIDVPPAKSGGGEDELRYSYFALLPRPGNPITSGMLLPVYCPQDDQPDIIKPSDDDKGSRQCEVTSAKAVRRVAQETVADWPKWRAIWVADAPYGSYGPTDDGSAALNVADD